MSGKAGGSCRLSERPYPSHRKLWITDPMSGWVAITTSVTDGSASIVPSEAMSQVIVATSPFDKVHVVGSDIARRQVRFGGQHLDLNPGRRVVSLVAFIQHAGAVGNGGDIIGARRPTGRVDAVRLSGRRAGIQRARRRGVDGLNHACHIRRGRHQKLCHRNWPHQSFRPRLHPNSGSAHRPRPVAQTLAARFWADRFGSRGITTSANVWVRSAKLVDLDIGDKIGAIGTRNLDRGRIDLRHDIIIPVA